MKIIYLFLILSTLIFSKNEVIINYRENEPLLGKGHYLKIGQIPIATYEGTTGYFSTVDIKGKNLEIKEGLKKIIIKRKDEIIKNQELKWEDKYFEIREINLNGLEITLKWDSLRKDQLEIMIEKWDFQKKEYEIEIEYHYDEKIEIMKLYIKMPQFNPKVYLDIDSSGPILKKQEYDKKNLILKKIKLNDYDMNIIENGLKVKLNSELSIGNKEYLGKVKLVPLIEIYPEIYLEESNQEDIFKNSKEIVIAAQLPKDLNFNTNYIIFGNLLELNYRGNKKEILEKTIILDGKNTIKRIIALEKQSLDGKIYLDEMEKDYYLLEKIGNMIKKYKNLKLKIMDTEVEIDKEGNSDVVITRLADVQVIQGKIVLFFKEPNQIKQGDELLFEILSLKDEILEEIELKIYFKN